MAVKCLVLGGEWHWFLDQVEVLFCNYQYCHAQLTQHQHQSSVNYYHHNTHQHHHPPTKFLTYFARGLPWSWIYKFGRNQAANVSLLSVSFEIYPPQLTINNCTSFSIAQNIYWAFWNILKFFSDVPHLLSWTWMVKDKKQWQFIIKIKNKIKTLREAII